jgi:hypothetical protein
VTDLAEMFGLSSVARCTPNADLENVDGKTDPIKATCAEVYEQLELCLAENQRDWRKCQEQMFAFKRCSEIAKQPRS